MACRAHAANKLFATAAAADSLRAHVGCKCAIVPLGQVERRLYDTLFAAGQSLSIDRRYTWVQAAFERTSTSAPPDEPDEPSPDPAAVLPVAIMNAAPALTPAPGSAVPRLKPPVRSFPAALRTVRIRVTAPNTRTLLAEIAIDRSATATLTLRRSNAVVASRVVQIPGSQIVGLPLPVKLAPGIAVLDVRLRDRTGRTGLVSKSVWIPVPAASAAASRS